MATTPKPIPVPWDSFQPSATEQIFARGVQDRDMSGLNYMLMSAMQGQREANHRQYSAGVDQANKQAQDMFAREQAQAAMLEQLKVAAGLAKEGFLPSGMPAMAGVMTDPAANDDLGQLMRQKLASEIGKNNATAAGQGGDNVTVDTQVTPTGVAYSSIKSKGKNAEQASAVAAEMVRKELERRGLVPPAGKPYGLASSVDQAEKSSNWAKDRYTGR